jgi:leucine dehydrogenase
MTLLEDIFISGYERVVTCREPSRGYHGIIAIHSTALGPAVGGTRLWSYTSESEALRDVLRLARGMTYKNAMAGLPLGGGKAVILKNGNLEDRQQLFRCHGRFVERLGGRFITAEDVGTTTADMDIVKIETNHVAGISSGSGDPAPWTALGVFRGIQASVKTRWRTDKLSGRTVVIQGCGNVGHHLAVLLRKAGAKLLLADLDADKASRVAGELNSKLISPDEVYAAKADILAPCAMGGVINDETIPQFQVEIIAGAANNQLLEDRHGNELLKLGILYAPDYVINAGGIISGAIDLLGWKAAQVNDAVNGIYETLIKLYAFASARGISTQAAANLIAEAHLNKPLLDKILAPVTKDH